MRHWRPGACAASCACPARPIIAIMLAACLRSPPAARCVRAAAAVCRSVAVRPGSRAASSAATGKSQFFDEAGNAVAAPAAADDADTPVMESSGWYNPRSIETRVSRPPRKRPESGVGRTKPPPSEEDMWFAAGAYGTDGPMGARPAAAPPAAAASPLSAAAADVIAAASTTAAEQPNVFSTTVADYPVVRASSGTIASATLPAFVRSYQLAVLPMYAALPGVLGARLLVSGVPMTATPAQIAASAWAPTNRDNHVTVTSVTTWATQDAVDAAGRDPAYQAAMQQLATYFKAAPTVDASREVAGWQRASAASGAAAAAAAEAVEAAAVHPPVGADLGLR